MYAQHTQFNNLLKMIWFDFAISITRISHRPQTEYTQG